MPQPKDSAAPAAAATPVRVSATTTAWRLLTAAAVAALASSSTAAEPVSVTPSMSPVLPPAVAAHFRDRGVTVDPRQEPAAPSSLVAPQAAEAAPDEGGRLRLDVAQRALSATVARLGLGDGDHAIAWARDPVAAPDRIDEITAVHDRFSRSTASFLETGALKRIANDRGEAVEIRRAGGRRTLAVRFQYGYARDERIVDLPAAAGAALDGMEAAATARSEPPERTHADVRTLRLSVKACRYWPRAGQLVDAWVDVDPKGKPGEPAPIWFPLTRRDGTDYAATVNLTNRAAVRRDPEATAAAVSATAADLCAVVGGGSTETLCAAFAGDVEATTACTRILEPFAAAMCPAVRQSEGWKVSVSPQDPATFRRPVEMRFNLRFLSPYGYGWVTSAPVEKVRPNQREVRAKVELPCWDVYEAPLKMTGSYQWPLCTSPYAEATSQVQFANYMKGWYAWAGLANWTLKVYQAPGCLSSNYVEGPFTPAGPAKLKGNYAFWQFDNAKYGGPDHFTGHINFDGSKVWGNVKDDRRWRRTSARATLYGEFTGQRAR